jgi:hypothetical protein
MSDAGKETSVPAAGSTGHWESGTFGREPIAEASGRERELDDLMNKASVFSSQSLQNLLVQIGDDEARLRDLYYNYADRACRLEAHFLFPNLEEPERNAIAGLAVIRSAVLVGMRNSQHYRSADARAKHESTLQQLKRNFVLLRAEIENRGNVDRLTPLQQRLLRREFMSIPEIEPAAGGTGVWTRRPGGSAA